WPKGVVGLGIHLPSVAGNPSNIPAASHYDEYSFVDVPGGVLRRITLETFLAHRDELRPASDRFIEFSAKAFANTPFARYHAPNLVAEAEQLLGSPLPAPRTSWRPSPCAPIRSLMPCWLRSVWPTSMPSCSPARSTFPPTRSPATCSRCRPSAS